MAYRFEREARTAHSEVFVIIDDDGGETGRVDLHFTPSITYGTLCLTEGVDEDGIQDLIGEIDERLVQTADPYREDFVVTVWSGRPAGVYSDEDADDEDDDEEFGENGNGPRI